MDARIQSQLNKIQLNYSAQSFKSTKQHNVKPAKQFHEVNKLLIERKSKKWFVFAIENKFTTVEK